MEPDHQRFNEWTAQVSGNQYSRGETDEGSTNLRPTKLSLLVMVVYLSFAMAAVVARAEQQALPAQPSKDEPLSAPGKSVKPGAKAATSQGDQPTVDGLKDYRIGEQDVLMVTVWREPELSGPVMVRPDGKITIPLVNEVAVVGMTPEQLQNMLTEKFHSFVTVPKVTVTVREINSRKVYVIGQVGKEGAYPINSTTTVLQIIAEAGGLREYANHKRIYVLRNNSGKQVRFPFNYDEVIKGRNYSQNILLLPGDTIVVP